MPRPRPSHQVTRPVAEAYNPLPGIDECSPPDYAAFRLGILMKVCDGATPRETAELLADGLDRFSNLIVTYGPTMRDEIRTYCEMGDTWCPPERRDLWEHFRSLPKGGGNVFAGQFSGSGNKAPTINLPEME